MNAEGLELNPGLTSADAAERLKRDGPNELPAAMPKSTFRIAIDVLREPMFLLLLAAGAVYLVLGSVHEAVALGVSILAIIGITLYQETKTERTLQALRDLSSPRAMVVRDGQKKRIAGRDVVQGDVLILSEGDRVAADALVIRAINLRAEESLLTGESVSVQKTVWDGHSTMPRPGGDDIPAVFSGTLIVKGYGMGVVTSTGSLTEVGKLGTALQNTETQKTNLELETASLVRKFTVVSLSLCLIIALVYGLTLGSWLKGALAGLALAISMVPEEFPVVLTIFLALGAWRISRIGVLTRRVPAIEMLGAATVLCMDKTGTLTLNKMEVRQVAEAPGHIRSEILTAAMFASSAEPVDPMEKAIHDAATHQAVIPSARLIREYPLTGGLLVMSRVQEHSVDGAYDVYAKGAPEAIAQLCHASADDVTRFALQMAEQGMRVLGVAHGTVPKTKLPESQREIRFEYLGLIGFEDPVRPSVPDAIRECHNAGIRVVMITGDFPATASSISQQIGLINPRQSVTGPEIEIMSEARLRECVHGVNVCFTTLLLGNLALIWTNRSRTSTVFGVLRSRNVALWAISLAALALLAFVLYVPAARNLFEFSTLHADDVAVCIGLALAGVTWFEIAKLRKGSSFNKAVN
jgi:Ca2+-transporting ATPase